MNRLRLKFGIVACLAVFVCLAAPASSQADDAVRRPLIVVVMDPMAAPLACDCVQGYAQRKYEDLGAFLQKRLRVPVKVYWSESLELALAEKTGGQVDLVIGKHSVVLSDARKTETEVVPLAALTDQEGKTTQTGLLVVRTPDRAQTPADLKGYRIFFGPADCDEKSAAPVKLLKSAGVEIPATLETYPACSTAATKLVELDSAVNAAAVISSYAQPLLEGCGAVKKGDLRVVGESEPVRFITAFANRKLSETVRDQVKTALLDVLSEPELLVSLETSIGFISMEESEGELPPKQSPESTETESADVSAVSGAAVTVAKKKN